ncbi:unnamed protein product [Amoebophrya sp. A120]|nr:unnamed protein product [Amoebophrya sp. A120]|eukprot:GSA120T00024796001.1
MGGGGAPAPAPSSSPSTNEQDVLVVPRPAPAPGAEFAEKHERMQVLVVEETHAKEHTRARATDVCEEQVEHQVSLSSAVASDVEVSVDDVLRKRRQEQGRCSPSSERFGFRSVLRHSFHKTFTVVANFSNSVECTFLQNWAPTVFFPLVAAMIWTIIRGLGPRVLFFLSGSSAGRTCALTPAAFDGVVHLQTQGEVEANYEAAGAMLEAIGPPQLQLQAEVAKNITAATSSSGSPGTTAASFSVFSECRQYNWTTTSTITNSSSTQVVQFLCGASSIPSFGQILLPPPLFSAFWDIGIVYGFHLHLHMLGARITHALPPTGVPAVLFYGSSLVLCTLVSVALGFADYELVLSGWTRTSAMIGSVVLFLSTFVYAAVIALLNIHKRESDLKTTSKRTTTTPKVKMEALVQIQSAIPVSPSKNQEEQEEEANEQRVVGKNKAIFIASTTEQAGAHSDERNNSYPVPEVVVPQGAHKITGFANAFIGSHGTDKTQTGSGDTIANTTDSHSFEKFAGTNNQTVRSEEGDAGVVVASKNCSHLDVETSKNEDTKTQISDKEMKSKPKRRNMFVTPALRGLSVFVMTGGLTLCFGSVFFLTNSILVEFVLDPLAANTAIALPVRLAIELAISLLVFLIWVPLAAHYWGKSVAIAIFVPLPYWISAEVYEESQQPGSHFAGEGDDAKREREKQRKRRMRETFEQIKIVYFFSTDLIRITLGRGILMRYSGYSVLLLLLTDFVYHMWHFGFRQRESLLLFSVVAAAKNRNVRRMQSTRFPVWFRVIDLWTQFRNRAPLWFTIGWHETWDFAEMLSIRETGEGLKKTTDDDARVRKERTAKTYKDLTMSFSNVQVILKRVPNHVWDEMFPDDLSIGQITSTVAWGRRSTEETDRSSRRSHSSGASLTAGTRRSNSAAKLTKTGSDKWNAKAGRGGRHHENSRNKKTPGGVAQIIDADLRATVDQKQDMFRETVDTRATMDSQCEIVDVHDETTRDRFSSRMSENNTLLHSPARVSTAPSAVFSSTSLSLTEHQRTEVVPATGSDAAAAQLRGRSCSGASAATGSSKRLRLGR